MMQLDTNKSLSALKINIERDSRANKVPKVCLHMALKERLGCLKCWLDAWLIAWISYRSDRREAEDTKFPVLSTNPPKCVNLEVLIAVVSI